MIHVGVDLHQRFCYITVMEARGKIAQAGPVTNEKLALRKYFRQFRGKDVQSLPRAQSKGGDALFAGRQALL